jgi:hypothetical protein
MGKAGMKKIIPLFAAVAVVGYGGYRFLEAGRELAPALQDRNDATNRAIEEFNRTFPGKSGTNNIAPTPTPP